jgi:hypothetical protein
MAFGKTTPILRIGIRLRARPFMLTIFIARCYLQILKCLAEATRISLAQSFSRNRSDRVSLAKRRDANRHWQRSIL